MTRKLSDCIMSCSSRGSDQAAAAPALSIVALGRPRRQLDFDARSIRPGRPEPHLPPVPADNASADRQACTHAMRAWFGAQLPEHPKRLFVIGGGQANAIVDNASDPAVAPGLDRDTQTARPTWIMESDRVQHQLLEHDGQ